MLTVLAWIGRIFSPAVAALTPGISPKLIMAMATVLAVLVAVGGPAGAVYIHMHAKQSAAEARINAEWKAKIAQSTAEWTAFISEAVQAVAAEPEPPSDRKELEKLCASSKLCRKEDS